MTTTPNITFSRQLLKLVHRDVKDHLRVLAVEHIRPDLLRVDIRQSAWVHTSGRDQWEFRGPDGFYWHGKASNAYEARAKGWQAWLKSQTATH